ncbi:hypothetical protein IQ07DRAFT_638295 [Pyrenochaeta sp. DS3sAY3a]|nr:hypothetical protein IQ07DRAFT_638295 [Pyrenochaeta sp. DS3sAY3a]
MAVRLVAWLEQTFEEQLLLGNHWLHDKNKLKASGAQTAHDRGWRELYHDNGSCLDIFNQLDRSQHSTLLASPLTLTDGRCQVRANLTTDCVHDFSARFPGRSFAAANTLIAVRRYTIQYTSYGPPNARLRFILRAVDWLGVLQLQGPLETREPWNSLLDCDEICSALRHLDNTRACEDNRCLQAAGDVKVEDEDMGGLDDEAVGAPLGEDSPQTQFAHTQIAFGTQLAHPIQPQRPQAEVQSNTAKPESDSRSKLLSLLSKTGFQSVQKAAPPPTADHVQQTASSKNVSAVSEKTEPAKDEQSERPKTKDHVPGSATRIARVQNMEEPSSRTDSEATPTKRQKKRASKVDKPDDTVLPDWMKGFIFDREALKVPVNQQTLLGNVTSWHHPQPGSIGFPPGNIPITILDKLSRIADEKAAEEGVSDTDSEENYDPTPDSILTASHKQSQEAILQVSQDEPTNTQVTWSASPESPVRPALSHHGLPPDSSFAGGTPTNGAQLDQQREEILHTRHSTTDESLQEKELSSPPSSPPRREMPVDSDEEMEMEASVPQALGEDAMEIIYEEGVQSSLPDAHSSKPNPIVLVKETPNAKDKYDQGAESLQNRTSIGSPRSTSSTSIVTGTYKVPTSSNAIQGGEMFNDAQRRTEQDEGQEVLPSVEDLHNMGGNPRDVNFAPDDALMVDDLPDAEKQASLGRESSNSTHGAHASLHTEHLDHFLETSPERHQNSPTGPPSDDAHDFPATLPSPKNLQTGSGVAKRKLGESPAKGDRRHSKRRELKIVDFGDDLSDISPATSLRQEREEALRKFREKRKPKIDIETPSPSTAHAKTVDKITVGTSGTQTKEPTHRVMSPRHRSLYEEPTLVKSERIDPKPLSLSSQKPFGRQPSIPASQSLESKDSTIPAQAPSAIAADQVTSVSIFLTFKAAYPEYTGDAKHFQGLCTEMFKLDQEDKMVPKWQWDDFIIRNRTDYKDYALDCVSGGENPEPYHRFYKDTIRDTFYRKGVVQSTKTLLKALEEFGVPLPVPRTQPQSRPPRSSLPNISSRQKRPVAEPFTTPLRPRRSLAGSSTKVAHSYEESPTNYQSRSATRSVYTGQAESSSSRSKPKTVDRLNLGRLSTPRASGGLESADKSGDIFRDYFFAAQRTTSLTGSTEVSPAVRHITPQ